jgi:hypothetical protein
MCPSIFNKIFKPLILAEVLVVLKVRTIGPLQYLQLQDLKGFMAVPYPLLPHFIFMKLWNHYLEISGFHSIADDSL